MKTTSLKRPSDSTLIGDEELKKKRRKEKFLDFKKKFLDLDKEDTSSNNDSNQMIIEHKNERTAKNPPPSSTQAGLKKIEVSDQGNKKKPLKNFNLFEDNESKVVVDVNGENKMKFSDDLEYLMSQINAEARDLEEQSKKKAEKTCKQVIELPEAEEVKKEDKQDDDDILSLLKTQVKVLRKVDHTKINYVNFRKNLYIEVPELKRMTKDEVREYRFVQLEKLKIRGKCPKDKKIEDICPKPIKAFTQCGLSDKMEAIMKTYGYITPTPIQAQAIPAVMSGFDVIGIAKTGSGKTLAFVLPMLRHILDQPPRKQGDGPAGLVLAPTRELAMQIHTEIKKFKKATKLTCVCVYGGANVQSQIGAIKRGADILVCTPGRLIDVLCLNKGKLLSLERVTFLVLDEADRMFDMGFEKQISHVIQNIRPDRQTVMFSATFPSIVQKAATQFLSDPIEITIRGGSFVPTQIDQRVCVFENSSKKYEKLLELIADFYQKGSVLIFVDTQTSVDMLFTQLMKSGYDVASYHAGLPQFDRESAMDAYKKGEKKILVATSLASRGLDVAHIKLVVNYDVPNHLEDYVHRVGRTGRAGNPGTAYTLISREEEQYATILVTAFKKCKLPVPEDLQSMADIFNIKCLNGTATEIKKGYKGRGYDFDENEEKKHAEDRLMHRMTYLNEEEVDKIATVVDEEKEKEIKKELEEEAEAEAKMIDAKERAQIFINNLNKAFPMGKQCYTDRFEINDYPQAARCVIMKNSTLNEICDISKTAITAKGQHIPNGKPPPGVEKLYLFIEGPDKGSIEVAKIELKRILKEQLLANAKFNH